MRLFLGTLIFSNAMLSMVYWITEAGICDIKEMLTYNGIWTAFYSLICLSAWLIEPYCNL